MLAKCVFYIDYSRSDVGLRPTSWRPTLSIRQPVAVRGVKACQSRDLRAFQARPCFSQDGSVSAHIYRFGPSGSPFCAKAICKLHGPQTARKPASVLKAPIFHRPTVCAKSITPPSGHQSLGIKIAAGAQWESASSYCFRSIRCFAS